MITVFQNVDKNILTQTKPKEIVAIKYKTLFSIQRNKTCQKELLEDDFLNMMVNKNYISAEKYSPYLVNYLHNFVSVFAFDF